MKFTSRFKLFASATAVLTAGLIGCQIHRGAQEPQPIAPEAPRYIEPLPDAQQPLLPPAAQVPPAEDELPVPSAGLSPIQRMCYTSCSSCPSSCDVSCCDPCCTPSFGSRLKAHLSGTGSKMSALHCRTKQFMSALNPFSSGCSSCNVCDPCCSPCMSCDPCCSDGFVVSDVAMPCSTGCGTWAPGGYGMQSGVWAPSAQPMMAPQGYFPQQYPQMPAQAPCHCQQGQAGMMHPGYAQMPYMGYGPMNQMGNPNYQQYPQMAQPGYGMQPMQQPVGQYYQHSQQVPVTAPAQPMAPGHTQPNYSQPTAVGPRSGLQ